VGTASLAIATPVGTLRLVEREGCLVRLVWDHSACAAADPESDGSALLCEAADQIDAYFRGARRRFELPLAPGGSPFQRRVWQAMAEIPYGRTATYGALAAASGSTARAVGGACGANPLPIVVPCHRVVASTGLGGYSGAGGLDTKRRLLELEGALERTLL
jgi:methylated-DNA-[protein]-cysteine S-methyltransferase